MKVLVVFVLSVVCAAGHLELSPRIVGGTASELEQLPYVVGLLAFFPNISNNGICAGSLVTPDRVITAAHCWYNGTITAYVVTVILGSIHLYYGGLRVNSSDCHLHPNWTPALQRNDVAVLYLPDAVELSSTISTIALPSGSLINQDLVGQRVIAAGYGLTSSTGSVFPGQYLSHVELTVITNFICGLYFPLTVTDSNICTAGGGNSTCRGDSGGPMIFTSNSTPYLYGIISYGVLACESNFPAVFARTTSFLDFFNEHI